MAYIVGKPGYERIYGTAGNDTIDSKGGSDLIYDFSNSNDTYIFGYGYGQPTYTDAGGFDTITFKDGIKAQDIKFYITKGGYLMPRIQDTTDKPEIAFWPDPKYKIERWAFEDGTILTSADVDRLIDYNTRVLVYTEGSDNVKIGQGNNLIYLMQGNDYFVSTGGNNIIEASSGNDTVINKGTGNDEIYMSWGIDYTEDRAGNDRYIYNEGDSHDTILDMGGNDTVKFGRSITRDDLIFNKSENDLVVTFKYGSYDSLTIKNWLVASNYKIETFELWDKSQITSQQVNQIISGNNPPSDPPPPPPPSDSPSGTDLGLWASQGFTPTVTGTDGYNYPKGYAGNDVYYLKKGGDRVMDYTGNDVYLFSKGDGQDNITDEKGNDVIAFGLGVTKNDVSFKKDPNNSENMIISINNSSDSININKWFRNANYQVEKVMFADGTYFTNTNINQIIQQISSYSVNSEPQIITLDTTNNDQNIPLVNNNI
ncbi:MAG: hypothetical protein A2287_07525 [Candidatus Melainabacteria bacterium RIFOXYA12_FULL_32_12]|nr:MAG: hypothetical protein A2255_08425 [Candidatus Melainabacteria bacterium RIFOXYA2_FULL_32_9]OGI29101.1 MAG: hypothetical protein A2287_07525 [Candidatus Melainabacteria bacterium RIFOXYA12_FULL_32_12]